MSRTGARPNPESADDLVMIGEIVKPHGIRGEVKAYPFSERPGNFRQYKKIFLQKPAGSGIESCRVVKSREQGKLAILELEGITSREAAEALQGSLVLLRKTDLPAADDDEYYWHELIGMTVVTETGSEVGKVVHLFSTKAHDVLVVKGGGREYLIPVKEEIIIRIDERQGRLLIAPPPGLLEANVE